ncbi:hypothetical protein BU17DRAFT_78381 [Hysterangium stoloniferum]|nr:hypothetical protein BU17DRAFT_78381 [Hysterangium stoloniferum]
MADNPSVMNLPKVTLTLRIIKSFEYRTEKSAVLHDVDLEQTRVRDLKDRTREIISTQPGWKPFRNTHLDTLKLYTKAHGAKTSNLIINLDHDELIFEDDDAFLVSLGVENETEISFFNRETYDAFKLNPQTKWT